MRIVSCLLALVFVVPAPAADCKNGVCQVPRKAPVVDVKVGPVKVQVGGGKVKHKRPRCKCKGCGCKAAK